MIVSGFPNRFCTSTKYSKNGPEFFRSFCHSRTKSASRPSHQARLPRALESSSARTFIPLIAHAGFPTSFQTRSSAPAAGSNQEIDQPIPPPKRRRQKNNHQDRGVRVIVDLRSEKNRNGKWEAGRRNIRESV